MAGHRFATPADRTGEDAGRVGGPRRPVAGYPGQRERVLTYLRGGAPLPEGYRTDGEWIWPDQIVEDLERHGVPPEPELSERIAALGYYCPPVTAAQVAAATGSLQRWRERRSRPAP